MGECHVITIVLFPVDQNLHIVEDGLVLAFQKRAIWAVLITPCTEGGVRITRKGGADHRK